MPAIAPITVELTGRHVPGPPRTSDAGRIAITDSDGGDDDGVAATAGDNDGGGDDTARIPHRSRPARLHWRPAGLRPSPSHSPRRRPRHSRRYVYPMLLSFWLPDRGRAPPRGTVQGLQRMTAIAGTSSHARAEAGFSTLWRSVFRLGHPTSRAARKPCFHRS
jgi:hypothetical protein